MFLRAFDYFKYLKKYRYAWFAGRVGGSKSLCSFATAERLLSTNYVKYLVTNISRNW